MYYVYAKKSTFILHAINIKQHVDHIVSPQCVHAVNIKKQKIKYLLSSRN